MRAEISRERMTKTTNDRREKDIKTMTVNQYEDRTDDKIIRQWTSENMTRETNRIQIIWRETMNEIMMMRITK